MDLQPLLIHPIGIIRTPFADRCDAPRQPGQSAAAATGKIILEEGKNFEQAVEDLSGFDKIWLIYQFDRNAHWKPKVLPPRGDRIKRGVFATRSPHRPNPIGLSLVTLLEVDGRNIFVDDVDILDKTPLFDIKPYLPYAEAFPDAKCGWLDETMDRESRQEPWQFIMTEIATAQFAWLQQEFGIDLFTIAERVLGSDPFPHPSRRIFKEKDGEFMMAIKSWRINYTIAEHTITIVKVKSGYSADALKAKNEIIHQGPVHEAFHAMYQ
ncbi:MAG: tRNA (N6-threonylcarbamoyladenosine(37)-N6)-methyltransferase TrmO [Bacteroidota bacterium]|nr:tRNA (N6-threonylcarbamoyladenosine(37)-N6)-methyltransferase TrmO [Bacteroidota bacterium]MDP4230368.1 tRNA (N6-threonylcarbamoyladenosine(37)-N6)-methyltransferase TrmO [Bacteroidota bacterium]MDP4236466.1 tRNA (N6-threonylcarbamoyladenosine(37)-N6)-methyltransferase TrmO [Bacteroidota bacterium]